MKRPGKEQMTSQIKEELMDYANPEKAKILSRFFKTGKGQYGEEDVFLGITVPEQRSVAKRYPDLPLREIRNLLSSRVHEHRLVSLLILVAQYRRSDETGKREIFTFYLDTTRHINNWDLVDLSAPNILGDYLLDKDRAILYRLANSKDIWERRMAIMATFAFIKDDQFEDTLRISEMLLHDVHDLIHKAAGWMLREIGKRDRKAEEQFLKRHSVEMPRTMLRYAIEQFDEKKRKVYLKK
jgi:3-methyladenine DNA glycosylase AlkD